MFEVDKQWLERLYQAIYLAESFTREDLVIKLKKLEVKFFQADLEDFEWQSLGDIEDELENMI